MDRAALDTALIDAHTVEDNARLAQLYTFAADTAETEGNIDACCFYLTHAYVCALTGGAAEADALHHRLLLYGRED
jgi:hypothetical protein